MLGSESTSGSYLLLVGWLLWPEDLGLQRQQCLQARTASWICWRIRQRSRNLKRREPCFLDETRSLRSTATIPGVISGESGDSGYVWFSGSKCHGPGHLDWEIEKFFMKIGFQHWRLQARRSPKRPRWRWSWQRPRPPKWLRRCVWMRLQRKAPGEGRNWPAQVIATLNCGNSATRVLVLELLKLMNWR